MYTIVGIVVRTHHLVGVGRTRDTGWVSYSSVFGGMAPAGCFTQNSCGKASTTTTMLDFLLSIRGHGDCRGLLVRLPEFGRVGLGGLLSGSQLFL